MKRGLGLVLAVQLLSGCLATVDFDTRWWTVTAPRRTAVVLAPDPELDALAAGCNAFLLQQRDAAITGTTNAYHYQQLVLLITLGVELAVGMTTLALKAHANDSAAAYTGGIGSVLTGTLGGGTMGLLLTPDPAPAKRRDAIVAAWDAYVNYLSAAASAPDPGRLLTLRQAVRDACAGKGQ
jgi:hypothetical protein